MAAAQAAPRSRWVELFGLDVRTLAVARVALAGVLLLNLADRARDLEAMYTDAGLAPRHVVRDFYEVSDTWWWSLHMLGGSFAFQAALLGVAGVLAVALLVGYRTRWATIGSWILLASLHLRMPLLVTGGDVLLCMLLFWAMFVPWGHCWSLDARRRARRQGEAPGRNAGSIRPSGIPVREIVFSPATAAMLLQVGLMYLLTGWGKCNAIWFSGEAIHNSLSYEMIARPLGRELLDYPTLLRWLTWATLGLEVVGPWLLFSPLATRPLRTGTALAFVALHVGIELTMRVTIFSFASLAALTLFLPPEFWSVGFWRRDVWRWAGGWRGRLVPLQRSSVQNSANGAESLPGETAVLLPATGRGNRWLNALVLLLLAYGVVANLGWQFAQGPLPGRLGKWFSRPAELLNFGQRWTMFVRPDATDYRFAAVARLRDGSQVDVLRDGRPVDFLQARHWKPRTPTSRWMLAFRELAADNKLAFRQSAAEYFYRRWNASQPPDRQIELLDLVLVQVRPWFDGASAPPMARLGRVDALEQGPHRNGQRHGNWVLRYPGGQLRAEGAYRDGVRQGTWVFYHENGRPSAQGLYVDDKESGRWTHWFADGRKEGQGSYVQGRMHGPWTFWYEDGRRLEILYDEDRPVSSDTDDAVVSDGGRR